MTRHEVTRYLAPAAVVAADTALLAAGHLGPPWVAALYAMIAALACRHRLTGFAAALALAGAGAGGYCLLLWTSNRAGRGGARRAAVAVAGAALGGLAVQSFVSGAQPRAVPQVVTGYLVFVGLPFLAGRYLAQQERLAAAQAERIRLAERLRIARDMHDSLGHRLSLVSIGAAALEVSALPPRQREAAGRLAAAARAAMTEVYEVVGALRDTSGPPDVDAVVAEFRAAGVPVRLRRDGDAVFEPSAAEAAYRVVQEGLTNAARHAPGRPVTVTLERDRGRLLVTVENRAGAAPAAPGHGLTGLAERVRLAGGELEHGRSAGLFRLRARLPAAAPGRPTGPDPAGAPEPAAGWDAAMTPARAARPLVLAAVAAILMFVVLPAGVLLGAG